VAIAEGFDEHFDLRVVGRIVRGRLDSLMSRHVRQATMSAPCRVAAMIWFTCAEWTTYRLL
jgi:hypothetical protein